MTTPSADMERLIVLTGEQAGASISVGDKESFCIGSEYHNDVVVRCRLQTVCARIETQRGRRHVKLLEGSACIRLEDETIIDLVVGESTKLAPHTVIELGDVAFAIESSVNDTPEGAAQIVQYNTAKKNRMFAFASIAAGTVLMAALGVHGFWPAAASIEQPSVSIAQQLNEYGLGGVTVVDEPRDDDATMLGGRVDSQEQFQKLLDIVSSIEMPVVVDVQIDSVVVDALRDIYRNHGIDVEISVLGKGHVKVEMNGVSSETLDVVDAALQSDLPMLHKVETINSPLVEVPEEIEQARINPEKEVEAVIAGDVSYVITRDQARYFVGAILPSGHTITSITDGTVVMVKGTEETTLNF